MSDVLSAKSNRLIFVLVQCAITCYGIFRAMDSIARGEERAALGTVISVVFVMLVVYLLHRVNRFISEAFTIPTAIFFLNIASSFLINSFTYYFVVYVCLCCMGALYLNPKKMGYFLLISHAVTIVLVTLRLPLSHHLKPVPFTEILVHWLLSIFGSAFIYIMVVFAANKNSSAVKAQDSFTALLQATPNREVLLDSLNRVIHFSKPFADMARLADPEMAIGRSIFDLFEDFNLKLSLYEILKEGDRYEGVREIILDGQQYYFEIITADLANETKGRLIMMIDITPVTKAKFEAEAASRSKSAFLATMSHEIRTPLNAIIGLSEIELQKKLALETRMDLEKIHNSGASLLGIINDILDISKIEAGSFEMVPVDYDVPSMVNDTVQLNMIRIGSKQIVFKLDIDETIPAKLFGDELRVKQILNNLLSNAFKYTQAGSVNFKIRWERRGDNAWLTFTVRDTGRGMRKEDIPRIFSEYAQLDARANRHIEGTGLGLSITRNLVRLMGGVINAESEYGKGSTFTVQIPQRILDKNPIGELTARNLELFRFRETRRSQSLRLVRNYMPYGKILVVDDVETNLDVAKGLMLPYGLSIDCALSGEDAIEKIRAAGERPEARYDLVLMDHMMPGMDGIEAVRIIRGEIGSDYAQTVPIIALTANALAGNEEMFLARGFTAYISKPIDIMQLDTALNTWVRGKQNKETIRLAELEKASQMEDAQTGPGVLDDLIVDGIDLVQGRERYNNEASYLNILCSYHLHTPGLLEKLRNLSLDGGKTGISLSEYAIVIHGLKGSSYGICANAIGKAAEDLETAARVGDFEKVLSGSASFIERVELLLFDLGELLGKANSGKAKKRKAPAPDNELLLKLLDAVKRYKSSAMEELLAEIESWEYEAGNELVSWLREQMDNLEYDSIRLRLEELQEKQP